MPASGNGDHLSPKSILLYVYTSIAASVKNPFRRTIERNHKWNYLNFSFFHLKLFLFFHQLQIKKKIKTSFGLIDFAESLNFGNILKKTAKKA